MAGVFLLACAMGWAAGGRRPALPLARSTLISPVRAIVAKGFGKDPQAEARTARKREQRQRVTETDDEAASLVAAEEAKGFGKDPLTEAQMEARIAKKLEGLRSPKQLQRMADERQFAADEAERDRFDAYVRAEGLDTMPEAISDRLLKRMLFFLGLPIAGGVIAFAGFIIAATNFDTVIRPQTVAITTQAIFALGVVGITYGPLSASWDEEREGSLLGFDEVGRNVESLIESMKGPPRM
ncbi:hypothetical protein T492DRAFT_945628 [Pavlovales sp. CCMP2436]|nr:hypothetical protein T492DRAFT_945628 [Pavlovales sp. CCMP2436]